MPVEISLLGPVEVTRDGERVELGSPQQRTLLALLALRPDTVTSVDAIVDTFWPGAPPPSAAKVVQTYISRLRKALGPDVIERRNGGYALHVPPAAVDTARFEELVSSGRPHEALALWRGPALAGLQALGDEAARLEELRRRAVEDRLELELEAGRHAGAVGSARTLLAEDPLRERALGQLMRALYASGRQAEALEVYRQARRRFDEELGLEPGPELRELERRILGHDPALAPPPARPGTGEDAAIRPRRRRVSIAAAVVVVSTLAVAAGVLALRDGERAPVAVRPNTIVRIDPETNTVVDSIPVGREPAAIVASRDAVWVANERDATLSRVDLRTRDVSTIGGVEDVAFLTRDTRGNVYASAWDYPFVWRIDPRTVEVAERYRVRTRALDLAVGGGSLWVVDRLANAVSRIDLARGSLQDVIPVGRDPLAIAFGFGSVWVANSDDGSVSAVRPGVRGTNTIDGILRPFGIAAGEGAVWVGSNDASTVTRIDPDTRERVAEINVSGNPPFRSELYDVAVGAGSVWALNRGDQNVVRIDPRTNRIVGRIPIGPGAEPRSLDVAGDAVWLSVGTPGYSG